LSKLGVYRAKLRAGFSTVYNGAGAKQSLIVAIPQADPNNKNTPTGTPTGAIFNSSPTDFLLAPGKPARFLFSTIDGTIAGWNPNAAVAQGTALPSTHAVTVVKTGDGSSYTGLTSAFIDGKPYLYAANFTKGRVDVYDNAFHPVRLSGEDPDGDCSDHPAYFSENSFVDEGPPRPYAPFNVQAMNAPWGVAVAAPSDFDRFSQNLLIGQFAGGGDTQSSGYIAAYDLTTGKFNGLLQNAAGKPLAIKGILALNSGNARPNNSDSAAASAPRVYFTAGPNHGSGGLFGYVAAVSTENHVEEASLSSPRSPIDIHAHINSTPSGADIQVDGAFVGATPSDIDLTCCWHDVTITKPGRKPWTRRVRITGGHLNINAQLHK
jgi:hypothetical protein